MPNHATKAMSYVTSIEGIRRGPQFDLNDPFNKFCQPIATIDFQFNRLRAAFFVVAVVVVEPVFAMKVATRFAALRAFFLQTVHSKQANRALKRKELLKRKKREE